MCACWREGGVTAKLGGGSSQSAASRTNQELVDATSDDFFPAWRLGWCLGWRGRGRGGAGRPRGGRSVRPLCGRSAGI